MSGRQVFLVGNSTKQGLMCLAQGHNAVRLELPTRRSRAKYSTTEPPPHIHVCKSRIKFGWISSNVLGDRIPDRRDGRRRLQYPQRFFLKKDKDMIMYSPLMPPRKREYTSNGDR